MPPPRDSEAELAMTYVHIHRPRAKCPDQSVASQSPALNVSEMTGGTGTGTPSSQPGLWIAVAAAHSGMEVGRAACAARRQSPARVADWPWRAATAIAACALAALQLLLQQAAPAL